MTVKRIAFLTVAIVLGFARLAVAEGFALYEYSARSVALSGTTMARRADPSAIASNPALITQLKGIHAMAGATAVMPRGKLTATEPDGTETVSHLKANMWLIPHAYLTYQINDNWFFGIGEFSRFGLGFDYKKNWPGRYNIYSVNLETISVNPNLAWKATDQLSLAAGVEIQYVKLDMNKKIDLRALGANAQIDTDINSADSTALGFNVAAHYQFNDEWAFGIQYRSQIEHTAKGKAEFTLENVPGIFHEVPDIKKYNGTTSSARGTVVMPDSIAAGLAWMPTQDFSVEFAATWTRWSTFKDLNIHLGDPVNEVSEQKKHWKDSWRLALGVEYDLTDWLTLRGAYSFDQSPMTSRHADYLVPTKHRDIYSGGLGFKWGDVGFDVAYSAIVARSRHYRQNDKLGTLDSHTTGITHLVSTSLSYSF